MNANDLRNAMLALTFIDRNQFWVATLQEELWGTRVAIRYWERFRDDPMRFYTRATGVHRDALFALIQKHLDEGKTND